MDIFIQAFKIFLYQPLLNALVFLYQYLPGHDFGLAIIALTILIRLILYPLMAKSIKSQKTLSDLQPKLQEIQQKHKDNKDQYCGQTPERRFHKGLTLINQNPLGIVKDLQQLPFLPQVPGKDVVGDYLHIQTGA